MFAPSEEIVRAAGLDAHRAQLFRSSFVGGVLADFAEEPPATMMVMAAHRHSELARAALGSTTMSVLNVLVVPGAGRFHPARRDRGPCLRPELAHPIGAYREVRPIVGATSDYDGLLDLVGIRRVVLIGEATHGTHEFYRERARITCRLIDELGFNAVAVEADWPDAYRVNRYVMGLSHDGDAEPRSRDFRRFPAWMWRNRDVLRFVEWLRGRNDSHRHPATKARFFGLDLYSLRASIEAVIAYLDRVDPAEARRARERYACFDHVGAEGQAYGYALAYQGAPPCENEVVTQLHRAAPPVRGIPPPRRMDRRGRAVLRRAERRVVRNAEEYYQQMYRAEVSSWNLRDRHMAATLDALLEHLERQFGHAKVVVWEHNSHVGDARATRWARAMSSTSASSPGSGTATSACSIGQTTFAGEVTAATDWGAAAERKRVRPALATQQ